MDSSSNLRRDMLRPNENPNIPYSRPATPPPEHPPVRIGFCGLGAMGYFMARNLANDRHSHPKGASPLLVYNRTRSKSEKLLAELGPDKVTIADSAMQIARECDVVLTNLANDAAVKSVFSQFKEALTGFQHDKPKTFVETSTCYPTLAGELDEMISGFPHTHLITCPVFGAPAAADKAQLLLVMSGDYRSKKEVAYILVPAIGRKVIDLGGNLEKAPTLKLIGNSMILGFMEVMAEALTLGEKSGVTAPAVHGLIKELFPSPITLNYANKMTNDLFDGSKGFAIDGALKDASHVRSLSTEFNSPMPVTDLGYQHMVTARALHEAQKLQGSSQYEVLDWSSLVAAPRVSAGLDGFNSGKHLQVEKEN
ncbi:NAD-binding protein [Fomitiporia mediterranea MF3/22]|uniref:NAD-binding protein n=1 Tax=Fomitiporia mediterranea (strain MF3/22) TaxID=694068 RepID=UPI00044094D8|nr:NAD-binding protein [Fomitiporia mediterranea MF3/22]EJD04439.1 NAD-binding protein [Fomitiporia mediterranea MF3/22]